MKGKILLAAFLAVNVAHARPTAVAYAGTMGVNTKIETPTTISSAHTIQITNDLAAPQHFKWTVTLCPQTQTERCISKKDQLTLAQGQSFKKTYNLQNVIIFHAAGSKTISAETKISGAVDAISHDDKWVDVHY